MALSKALVCAALLCVAFTASGGTELDGEPLSAEGRKLLGWNPGYYHVDNSGDVWAVQLTGQKSVNDAEYNWGPVKQNSANGAITSAGNGNKQGVTVGQQNGRKLLGWNPGYYHVDNSGNVWAFQLTGQKSVNVAEGNQGPVKQNSANAAITSAGNGNQQGIGISQTNGRKLLGWNPGFYKVDNSGNVFAFQATGQKSGNFAYGNSGPVDQNSANAAITSAGNGNQQGIGISQTNKP